LIFNSGITAIAAGELHSLFLKDDGTMWARGRNAILIFKTYWRMTFIFI
jgi:alpha-tubulin suppressor-like RCC1 family protein